MEIEKIVKEVYKFSKEIETFSNTYKKNYEECVIDSDIALDYYFKDMIRAIIVFNIKLEKTIYNLKKEDEKQWN